MKLNKNIFLLLTKIKKINVYIYISFLHWNKINIIFNEVFLLLFIILILLLNVYLLWQFWQYQFENQYIDDYFWDWMNWMHKTKYFIPWNIWDCCWEWSRQYFSLVLQISPMKYLLFLKEQVNWLKTFLKFHIISVIYLKLLNHSETEYNRKLLCSTFYNRTAKAK